MSQYEKLDTAILEAVSRKKSPLYDRDAVAEANRIGDATGREGFRVIDGRLQALRRAGLIVHLTKAESNGSAGWRATGAKP